MCFRHCTAVQLKLKYAHAELLTAKTTKIIQQHLHT